MTESSINPLADISPEKGQEIPHTPARYIDYSPHFPPVSESSRHSATSRADQASPYSVAFHPYPYIHPTPQAWSRYPPSNQDTLPSSDSSLHEQPETPLASPTESSGKRKWRTAEEKLGILLELLKEFNWTIGDLLLHLFVMESKNGKPIVPSQRHLQMVTKFLTGETIVGVSRILKAWFENSAGLPSEDNIEREMMYGLETSYFKLDIQYARPAITSFAAAIIRDHLVKEAQRVVKVDAGLHTFTSSRNDQVSQYDMGAHTFSDAMEIFQKKMPLAWDYLLKLAAADVQALSRVTRPPHIVATHVLSALAYSRNMYAKLLPLEKGILNFACCANQYIYQYDSRLGIGLSYHAVRVCDALKKLAAHDGDVIRAVSMDTTSSWILRFDNVQHYIRPRNFRVGREAMMKIGTAGTVFKFLDFSPSIVDIDRKNQILAENRRKDLTFEKLISMIDIRHISKVCALQWLRVLVNFVPCLEKYKVEIQKLYKTDAAKKILPPRKTQIFPLPTNGRNETITAELLPKG